LHLTDGVVFVIFHPLPQTSFYVTQMIDSVAQQGRAEHSDIGANHEHLNNVFSAVNSAGGGQTGLDASIQDADPRQRQAQGLRCAQQDIRSKFQFVEINIGLVETIEKN
jgi:hypothetical protein